MRYHEIIATEAATQAGIIKPQGPLTPAQARTRAERKAGIQQRIADQQSASAQKLADLRAKLVSR